MKKNLLSYFFVIIGLFLINILNVNATDVCVYGTRSGNDSSTWKKALQIEISGWSSGSISINQPQSPFLSNLDSFERVTGKKYNYHGELEEFGDNLDYYVYASFFPNETVYENMGEKKCPKILRYERYDRDESLSNDKHLVIYNDDLDKKDVDLWLSDLREFFGTQKSDSGNFILESEKETPVEDLEDKYGCLTYASGIQAMKDAIKENKKKSCNNNPRFSDAYQNLNDACAAFRASANYASDDDGQAKAKACSKACSMIYDDVAEMCGVSPEDVECGSLGSKVVKWMYRIIKIVRYVIPVLLIILSALEFIKSLTNEDKLKDATKHFAHRLIAAALIFIIPFILDFLLKMFNIPGLGNNPFCS